MNRPARPTTSWSGDRRSFPPHVRRRILQRDDYTCVQCGGHATIADHVIPRGEGGADDETNGQALCVACHHVKTQQEIKRGRARRSRRRPPDRHPGLL